TAGATARERPRLSRNGILSAADEYAEFLSHQPPFDAVGEDERRAAAEAAELLTYPAGTPALIEDADPSVGMFVVRTGSMDLIHGDQLVDVLEPGECFGHPSMLTGMAPAFSIVAREDSSALLVPRDEALAVLEHPAGVEFVGLSLRERLVRSGQTV